MLMSLNISISYYHQVHRIGEGTVLIENTL